MADINLDEELDKLRSEVSKVANDNSEAIVKLNTLIGEIEKKIAEPGDKDHHKNLVENLRESINQFETEHPRATAILNDIMVSLSNMGI